MDGKCFFAERYGNDCKAEKDACSNNKGPSRIKSIIEASNIYGDGLCKVLEEQFALDQNLTIAYHKNCVSKYTSKTNLSHRVRSRRTVPEDDAPPKKRLRHTVKLFDFKQNCLYCGNFCDIHKDSKNPSRWRPAFMIRTTHSEHGDQTYSGYLLNICQKRGDRWAEDVKLRVQGAVSDLHAAEARYHHDCMTRFRSNRGPVNPEDMFDTETMECTTDTALQHVIAILSEDRSRLWNSIELHKEYTARSGSLLSRRSLMFELQNYFGEDLLVLSSPGIASILTFRSNTAQMLKIVKDDDGEDLPRAIRTVSKQILNDCKEITLDKSTYSTYISKEKAAESTSVTVMELLGTISPKLDQTLPALLIGNIITSVVNNGATDIQVTLGVLMRHSKELLSHLYDYRVTCSYDEVLRFKKSAAVSAAGNISQQGISDATAGLVQVVVDNFDCDIASPNGKSSTHSLAMIIMQPQSGDEHMMDDTIRRLKKDELSRPIENDEEPLLVYNGPKKPVMSRIPMNVVSDEFRMSQEVSQRRSDENNLAFFHDILYCDKCPEFNGYDTRICREQGHSLQPKTRIVYLPLIDMPPADPSAMLTAMVNAQNISRKVGQDYVIFTCDQQLYRVALHVKWDNPELLDNVYLRLGGMHLLMSYIGSVGSLMVDTGLEEILNEAFGGVSKMLSGKKYPQNIRALRMVVEELHRHVFREHVDIIDNMTCLLQTLDALAAQSRTSKLWVDCLIKPVLTMMSYIRAERESDWGLHLASVEAMIPLFFAAGHINYARYALYYLRSMHDLPSHIQDQFRRGQHTMHHKAGIYNGIWSDMAIETTFMRYGHSQGGIVGITLKPETLKTWAYSIHICHSILNDLADMRDAKASECQITHKEETDARIKSDAIDRRNLSEKLELSIDPLSSSQCSGLVNIVTGQVISHPAINVDNAVDLGKSQMESFEQSWPAGFYNPISKVVNTIGTLRKHIKVGDINVCNTEVIYARSMALQNSSREIEADKLMSYELSPVPTSMFDDHGQMRLAKTKSNLKNALQTEITRRRSERPVNATFLDGCAVLWVVPWPSSSASVQDYIDRFRIYIHDKLRISDVYLIFDRYIQSSIKEATRHARDKAASRVYTLSPMTRLPAQSVVLTVTTNKVQLIDMIMQDLISHKDDFQMNSLVITGSDPVPVEITHGQVTQRDDMRTTQEEADTIIVQQVSRITGGTVMVVADDTDIFLLLLYFCNHGDITCNVLMVSPVAGRAVLDISETVQKQTGIIPDLLQTHALTGCDTVASCFGIGKATGLKVLKAGTNRLNLLGDTDASISDVEEQAVQFMLACYGQSNCRSLTEARQKIWTLKVGRSKAAAPALCSLPPTTESFRQNILRAHLQMTIWLNSLESHPPDLDPTAYGWSKDKGFNTLSPTTVAEGVNLVPEEILKLIKCSCRSDKPCQSNRCSCKSAGIACTVFCVCQSGLLCHNRNIELDEDDS